MYTVAQTNSTGGQISGNLIKKRNVLLWRIKLKTSKFDIYWIGKFII